MPAILCLPRLFFLPLPYRRNIVSFYIPHNIHTCILSIYICMHTHNLCDYSLSEVPEWVRVKCLSCVCVTCSKRLLACVCCYYFSSLVAMMLMKPLVTLTAAVVAGSKRIFEQTTSGSLLLTNDGGTIHKPKNNEKYEFLIVASPPTLPSRVSCDRLI